MGLLGHHRLCYFHEAWKKYHGMPFEEFEEEMRKIFPFCEVHFDGGGMIEVFTGELVGGEDVYYTTSLWEEDGHDCGSVVVWKD
jgi:hypothetical protein